MVPIAIDGPAVEPVSVPEMRAFLRLDDGAEDELVAGLVKAARLLVEASSRRILVEQRWRLRLDRWPVRRLVLLPLSPLLAVESVGVRDAAGTLQDLGAGFFEADPAADPPRIRVSPLAPEPGLPAGGIEIVLRAGYGAAAMAVPPPLRLAIRMLAARWFENRGDLLGQQSLPPDIDALLAPFRRARL
ncbi:MAG TPA: hypothetical protein VHL98_00120 [Microvirga sp.]|jgi:uncharacterized phiE125 gp8 family phage protein|nr:hypothetical protein [Microvirga sp.]